MPLPARTVIGCQGSFPLSCERCHIPANHPLDGSAWYTLFLRNRQVFGYGGIGSSLKVLNGHLGSGVWLQPGAKKSWGKGTFKAILGERNIPKNLGGKEHPTSAVDPALLSCNTHPCRSQGFVLPPGILATLSLDASLFTPGFGLRVSILGFRV